MFIFLVFFLIFLIFVCLAILVIIAVSYFQKYLTNSSGWNELLQKYATSAQPIGKKFTNQTVQIGITRLKNIASIFVSSNGLFLSIDNQKYLFIPYAEIEKTNETTIYWQKAHQLYLKNFTDPLTVFDNIYQEFPPNPPK